jgi:hypothetical protein
MFTGALLALPTAHLQSGTPEVYTSDRPASSAKDWTTTLTLRAEGDMDSLSWEVARRILLKVHAMQDDLAGDVKRLTKMTPA